MWVKVYVSGCRGFISRTFWQSRVDKGIFSGTKGQKLSDSHVAASEANAAGPGLELQIQVL